MDIEGRYTSGAISKMREDLFDISYKPTFSKMYDDRGRLIGHIGYGFFIRKALGYRIYRYHIYHSSDCFTYISKMLNRKSKLFFDMDLLKMNLGTGLKVFEKFEDAKKFCILKYLENTNHNDF